MEVKDNFLDDIHLLQLDQLINNPHFAWYFMKSQVKGADDGYLFSHSICDTNTQPSIFYNSLVEIFKNNEWGINAIRKSYLPILFFLIFFRDYL